jgi:hypothetical protein
MIRKLTNSDTDCEDAYDVISGSYSIKLQFM